MTEKTFTSYEIANFCGVSPSTILNWIEDGRLKAYSTPGGHRRVTAPDLLSFSNASTCPCPRNSTPTGRS